MDERVSTDDGRPDGGDRSGTDEGPRLLPETVDISVRGAQVLAWLPPGGDDVLFVSERAVFAPGKAIRGGIPVCYPWFGAGPSGDLTPSHGYARTSDWEVLENDRDGRGTRARLRLAARETWPAIELEVRAAEELTLSATVTGEPGASCELALHTYLRVGDARHARVVGLDGARYEDKVTGRPAVQAGDVTFTGETDRIYLADGPVTLVDAARGRAVEVLREGFGCVVVWNPWVEKAASLADLGDDEWRGFVCIEAAAVGERAITLGADGTWTGRMTLRTQPA